MCNFNSFKCWIKVPPVEWTILFGFPVLYLMIKALIFVDFIRIDSDELVFNTLSFVFWGLIISLIAQALIYHIKQVAFYWMLFIWIFSFLGFVTGKHFGFKVIAVISIFIFLMILWKADIVVSFLKNRKNMIFVRFGSCRWSISCFYVFNKTLPQI